MTATATRTDRLDELAEQLQQARRGELTAPEVIRLAQEAQRLATDAGALAGGLRAVAHEMRTGNPF